MIERKNILKLQINNPNLPHDNAQINKLVKKRILINSFFQKKEFKGKKYELLYYSLSDDGFKLEIKLKSQNNDQNLEYAGEFDKIFDSIELLQQYLLTNMDYFV